ncbi:beta-ketoacyl-ACP synthase III [Geothermobacter hydrogeniphilus]|uniref:Beta-ketoacyl-ACP synthase III n=1 Tax=Geothermobacter hydrogeniphilus TaxID=1969733 RepID=A0A1X0Y0H8_9BACT|nr:beta-ketoacyl-ACP synthase III [Geothermobacter hydrogeniphilus]ORJ58617.1 beta-ketoacyl-ACP synthase III [Geothermobacter hydrogeniphilus]
MKPLMISGTGLYTPPEAISNQELVTAYNRYVAIHNRQHAGQIAQGQMEPLPESSCEFIEKASGIKNRYVVNKSGILDPEIMCPRLPERSNEEPSLQCEMGVAAARQALQAAGKNAAEVGAVMVACSNLQRPYPAVAIEIQHQLGIEGFAVDMNMACSSATFAIQSACDAIARGQARAVLVINPEICTGHLNFRDRDSHFIFGDACTAILIEAAETCTAQNAFEILSTRLTTSFSNNIRNNFGFLNRATPETINSPDKLFIQQGRKVFKEVIPMVAGLIRDHLAANDIAPDQLRRLWLHQANLNMNLLISKKVLGREASAEEAPVILDRYANTSSAGSIIAFHLHHDGLAAGDLGVICSFGAGYSAGSVIVRKT